MFTIAEHVEETPSIRTIRFKETLQAVPAQFVMVWVPGVDEFPMSASFTGRGFGITYQILGDGTRALAEKKPGDRIGIRGPYGNGFALRGSRLLVVAGGAGMAALGPFVEETAAKGAAVDVVIGARTANEILFEKRSMLAGGRIHISTDDGTKGSKGFATELASSLLDKERYDCMYACGPELMIVGLLKLATEKGIPIQASLERLMKCGIGICDSCALDGKHVCKDGPVFSEADLRAMLELGKTKLDHAGRKVPI
jgi:dihydroorotate dehydrogenase electron transfer subunit